MHIHDLFLIPDVPDDSEIQEGVEGLAWEHATLSATLSDIEIGSEEFIDLHRQLLERYRKTGDYLAFVQHTAMRLLQALLMTNQVALVVGKDDTSEDASRSITLLGQVITSCLMWFYAAESLQWVSNTEWQYLDEDHRGVDFPVALHTECEKDDDYQ